jgi:diadenosine tetraphosphate (Ap4A) HIT family hydrolase
MSQAFGEPAFAVDTHIHRLAHRWRLSNGRSVEQTERDLKKVFPPEEWSRRHLQIIYFGREYCPARGHVKEECPICSKRGGWDPVDELEVSSVMTADDGPMRGYCWVPLRRHAVELHDLEPDEAAAYMRDLMRVSRAVQAVTGAVKINCEIHGNTVPHLHTHIFPRYRGDRFENGPIDPRAVKEPVYGAGELER